MKTADGVVNGGVLFMREEAVCESDGDVEHGAVGGT